jgi:hypothetical protein
MLNETNDLCMTEKAMISSDCSSLRPGYFTDCKEEVEDIMTRHPNLLLHIGAISQAEIEAAYPGIDGLLIMFTADEMDKINEKNK